MQHLSNNKIGIINIFSSTIFFIISLLFLLFYFFFNISNPSHTQILGLHFEQAIHGQLKYLNLNTTYNSSIRWNYRQTESAFWTQYLPTVVGYLVPIYPPTTEVIFVLKIVRFLN